MTRRTKWILASTAVTVLMLVLVVAGIGSAIVLAQEGTSTPAPTQTPAPAGPGQALRDFFWQSLAGKLNVTLDQLRQAIKDAAKDTVAKAQQEGKLTADQAKRLNERIDAWPGNVPSWPFFFGPERRFGFKLRPGKPGIEKFKFMAGGGLDAAATTLGMSRQDLIDALRSGKTLAQLAQEKNVDQNKLKTAILDAEKAAVDQAVEAGRLTREKGDQLKARIDQRGVDLNQPFGGPGFWFKGMPWNKFGPRKQPAPTPTPGGILF